MKSLNNLRNHLSENNQLPSVHLLNVKGGGDKRDRPAGGAIPTHTSASSTLEPMEFGVCIDVRPVYSISIVSPHKKK
jgi:hypothetical protein